MTESFCEITCFFIENISIISASDSYFQQGDNVENSLNRNLQNIKIWKSLETLKKSLFYYLVDSVCHWDGNTVRKHYTENHWIYSEEKFQIEKWFQELDITWLQLMSLMLVTMYHIYSISDTKTFNNRSKPGGESDCQELLSERVETTQHGRKNRSVWQPSRPTNRLSSGPIVHRTTALLEAWVSLALVKNMTQTGFCWVNW